MKKQLFHISLFAALFILVVGCKSKNYDDAGAKDAGNVATSSNASESYSVVAGQSVINWEGYKPTGTHSGTVNISEGTFAMKNGNIESGQFTIDMSTITNADLEGKMKENLEAHLKGTVDEKRNDFFDIRTYPTGGFAITKVTKLMNDPEATHIINGNLTLRDITKQVSFRAKIESNGGRLLASSVPFQIDRTEWNIQFKSKKFFDNLKDNFVNDEIGIRINLVAKKG
jgi:polyisoprenoid-binding protein YceI